jgi:nucleotide-binding universal stress UspA family protein
MRLERILLAVDDSPAGLAAARTAMALAVEWSATVRALCALQDGDVARSLAPARGSGPEDRLAVSATSILNWVANLAKQRSVPCETVRRSGDPFQLVLAEARQWDADVIVIGRASATGPASAYLGSEIERLIEFTDRPVLVIPAPPA